MTLYQGTLREAVTFSGTGIHTGSHTKVTVFPAEPDTGRRIRCRGVDIPCEARYVVDTTRCTTLGVADVRVSTVEHLLSALAAAGVDNAEIVVEGVEIPILDGSALPFAEAIREAGVTSQTTEAICVTPEEPFSLALGASAIHVAPAPSLQITVCTDFDCWPEGRRKLDFNGEGYLENIAPARTFAFQFEVQRLLDAGLARGGSLDNALVIDPPDWFSSPLRVESEWCAHKLLDLLGDLALVNRRIQAAVTALRPGHTVNVMLAQELAMRGDKGGSHGVVNE